MTKQHLSISCVLIKNWEAKLHVRLFIARQPIWAITKIRLFKYIENFTTKKWRKFSDKNSDIFHISAQNLDCVYSLEPPRRGGSDEYTI